MGEPQEENDLFFVCSVIEYISRKTKILKVNNNKNDYIETLINVLSSWIIEKIDDYNSSMYYENPDYIYECYIEGKIL